MKNKILFVSNVAPFARHSKRLIQWLREEGYAVDYAANGIMPFEEIDAFFGIPIERSPFSLKNIAAYRQLKKILAEGDYRLVHCHTPMGGFLARLTARKYRKKGLRVLYSAHGFHFYKGAPLINWLLYYMAEKLLAPVTDCLITMNHEDYARAQAKLRAKRVAFVHGVGLDAERFRPPSPEEKSVWRKQLGLRKEDFILLYIGEMKKHQDVLIRALKTLESRIPEAKLLLAGDSWHIEEFKALAEELGLRERVFFLGWRSDIRELLGATDLYLASSSREGLPVNIMEAMAARKPIIATDIRGHNDLIQDGISGTLVPIGDAGAFAREIERFHADPKPFLALIPAATEILQPYLQENVLREMQAIYEDYLLPHPSRK